MEKKIDNPWENIKAPEYCTEVDLKLLNVFNNNKDGKPHFIHLDLMPEPYIGNPGANVIFLFANPGYGGNEKQDYEIPGFKQAIEKNLTHSNTDYPHYYFNPAFVHKNPVRNHPYTDGGKWIRDRTRVLRERLNFNEEILSQKIFTIQLHPYHSAKYKPIQEPLSVHNYAMHLFLNAVERAKKKEALIICARSYKYWNIEYQNLTDSQRDLKTDLGNSFIEMLYPRNVYFTPNHMGKDSAGEDNFEKLVCKLSVSI